VVRAVVGALVICCTTTSLSGCFLFHRHKDESCREKAFAQNTDNHPPLKVPAGMSAPDTRSAIQVPQLDTPERVRAKSEPCLSRPPNYFNTASPHSGPDAPSPPLVPLQNPTPPSTPSVPSSSVPAPPAPRTPEPAPPAPAPADQTSAAPK
jgi:hypothetical protein